MSLDGYIADRGGNVDWLQGQTPGEDDMISYKEFILDIDTVIMGWNTYHQLTTQLSPGEWMYPGLTSYIMTHRDMPQEDRIKFSRKDICILAKDLRKRPGKGIWICGGAGIVQPLIREDLIDEYYISIIPTILGGGIRLFKEFDSEKKLRLIKSKHYNGITDVVYGRR